MRNSGVGVCRNVSMSESVNREGLSIAIVRASEFSVLRLPCRKDWLCLPKRALLSWPGRSSRARDLRAKSTPGSQESSTSLQKGLALAREESVAVVAGPVESRRETYGQRGPLQPRCREANGGVAVVAAGAAMNRNGGHHAEFEHS